jgi:hypothetical protein
LAKQFQRRGFVEIDQPETRIAYGGHVCMRIETKLIIFIDDLPYMLPTMFQFTWPSSFRGGDSNVKGYHTDDGCQVITRAHVAFDKVS